MGNKTSFLKPLLRSDVYTQSEEAWFALNVKPRHEKAVAAMLRGKGYEEFLPLMRCVRGYGRNVKAVLIPTFPTYLFCRFDPLSRLPILTVPGVFSIVGLGSTPTPVDELEIENLRRVATAGLDALPSEFFRTGQRVRVLSGPLRGATGLFVAEKGKHHLILSITLLQRAVCLEIDRDCVMPFDRADALDAPARDDLWLGKRRERIVNSVAGPR
jgi:transcription antitermination factor NusG